MTPPLMGVLPPPEMTPPFPIVAPPTPPASVVPLPLALVPPERLAPPVAVAPAALVAASTVACALLPPELPPVSVAAPPPLPPEDPGALEEEQPARSTASKTEEIPGKSGSFRFHQFGRCDAKNRTMTAPSRPGVHQALLRPLTPAVAGATISGPSTTMKLTRAPTNCDFDVGDTLTETVRAPPAVV
jgi:hypothetical protein